MARFNATIRTADAGITSNAFFRRRGSPPAMAPMIRELTASPHHPHVMTRPIAVPDILGNASPTMAIVVGKTGAIERPAMNTNTNATNGALVLSIRKVVIAIATEARSVTVEGGTYMSIGDTPTRPMSNPSANPSERIFNARDSGIPWAMRCLGNQFQTPISQEKYRNIDAPRRKSSGLPNTGPAPEKTKPCAPMGAGILVAIWIARVTTPSDAIV